ncbi:uncharacterized protein O3C94_014177 isoform 2-T5 [Discoglossus pictus]
MSGLNGHLSRTEEEDSDPPESPCPGALTGPQIKKRKLVLHLDLNNTILVSDAVTNQGPHAALNMYLSTVTWGQLSDTGEWEWLGDRPSVAPPRPGAISYYSQFGRSSDFTNTPVGHRFKETVARHMELLEWTGEPDRVFTLRGEDRKKYHYILPSFFHLLQSLHQQGRDFCVLLRTFGTDLPSVLPAVQSAMMGNHPLFPQLKNVPLTVDLTPGRIRCSNREAVLTRGSERVTTKGDKSNIYKYFSNVTGIRGFQDHFDWWARHSFTNRGGKPFWVDPDDCDTQHIIIDDNIRLSEEDTIVNCQAL